MRFLAIQDPLALFVLRALAWLPVIFFLWYWLADLLILPLVYLAQWIFHLLMPEMIESVHYEAGRLLYNTLLMVDVDGRHGAVVIEVNVLKYSYNLPLLVALMFAASDRYFSFGKLLAIYLVLLLPQLWGVSFEFLLHALFFSGAEVAEQVGIEGIGRDLIGLGYQFGYLMLPSISAAALWIYLNYPFVEELLASRGGR